METVKKETIISTNAQNVWDYISNFNRTYAYISSVTKSAILSDSRGTVRKLDIEGGVESIERLEYLNNETMTLKYSIIEAPFPIKNYLATMQVETLEDELCKFTWSSVFEPNGAPAQTGIELASGLYESAFTGLRQIFPDKA